MKFKKYQHVEKFGNLEVLNIEIGKCFIFPKIDGTNSSAWMNGEQLCGGSRNRSLSLEKDNAGFCSWLFHQDNIINFFKENKNLRLYGEWLVPHSLKTYKENAWKKFYVFDVCYDNKELENEYMCYDDYQPLLEKYNIDYIPLICSIKNTGYDQLIKQLEKNVFLINDGQGIGEGIVIKNYEYKNKFNKTKWAKIVTSEFKEKHSKEMGSPEMQGARMIEDDIINDFVTEAFIKKTYAKIAIDGWTNKKIPQLLNTVFYDLIKEESWNFIKKFKNPTVNYRTLSCLLAHKIKKCLPEIFTK